MSQFDKFDLNKIYSNLLDTGKKNQLINFDETHRTNVKILLPKSEEVYNGIINSTCALYSRAVTVKSQQIILDVSGEEYEDSLSKIQASAQSSIMEQAVNVLYISYGILHWADGMGEQFCSPLLLFPVKFLSKSIGERYKITTLNGETNTNLSLEYRLKQNDINVELPAFDGDSGNYFAEISDLIKPLGWSISVECYLGIFSFPKVNIYYDIKENEQLVKKHFFVKALVGESSGITHLDTSNLSGRIDDHVSSVDTYNVVDADSSQLRAILAARQGKSFVLQGPPGTGKSQTITNIISEFLGIGKTVLFVAQKEAALGVVLKNLSRVKLDDFCLPLFSNKESAKEVVNQIAHSVEMDNTKVNSDRIELLKEVDNLKQQLNAYVDMLHTNIEEYNLTLYDIFNNYIKYHNAENVYYEIKNFDNVGIKELSDRTELLDMYYRASESIGSDDYKTNLFYGFKAVDVNLKLMEQIRTAFKDVATRLIDCSEKYDSLKKAVKLSDVKNVDQLLKLPKTLEELDNISSLNANWFVANKFSEFLDLAEQASNHSAVYLKYNILLSEIFFEKLFDEQIVLPKCYSANGENDLKVYKKEISANYKILKSLLKSPKVKDIQVIEYTKLIHQYYTEADYFTCNNSKLKAAFGDDYDGVDTDWAGLLKKLYLSIDVSNNFNDVLTDEYRDRLFAGIRLKDNEKLLVSNCCKSGDGLKLSIEKLQKYYDPSIVNLCGLNIEELDEKIKLSVNNMSQLSNWVIFTKLLIKLKAADLIDFIDTALNRISPMKLKECYTRQYYLQLLDKIRADQPLLKDFTSDMQNLLIDKFVELDELQKVISIAQVRQTMSKLRPIAEGASTKSEVGMLNQQKMKCTMPIKKLFLSIKRLIRRVKPCLLMSPLSVSTYLDPHFRFDLVIFDEASQVTPADAIGAIYRGNQIIVVGDSEQLPPTNFFKKLEEVDDTEDVCDIVIGKSILETAATVLEAVNLKWHYRSKNEQLIALSNSSVYNNSLVTFPEIRISAADEGIEFIHTPEGIYSRGGQKTNNVEAEKVVEILKQHIEKYPERSIGIVTFNDAQRDNILRYVNKFRQENVCYESFFDSNKNEAFFVKNIENVQGDERDTIVFSVCYGKDVDGKFTQNFGPISSEGGYKRLNVAITRAKVNMKVIASFLPTDIVLSDNKSRGVKMFAEFLQYAMTKKLPTNGEPKKENLYPIKKEICEFLKSKGIPHAINVGNSDFVIDIAVQAQNDSEKYVLGIILDGKNYRQCMSARDRDRLRGQVLANLGWKIYNVWSAAYYLDPQNELDKLMVQIDKANKVRNKGHNNVSFDVTEFESQVFDRALHFKPYNILSYGQLEAYLIEKDNFEKKNYDEKLKSIIELTLKLESPISVANLLNKICHFYGVGNATKGVETNFMTFYNEGKLGKNIIIKDDFVIDTSLMMEFRAQVKGIRKLSSIYFVELASLLKRIIYQNIGLGQETLSRQASSYCGYEHTQIIDDKDNENISRALEYLNKNLSIEYYNSLYYSTTN